MFQQSEMDVRLPKGCWLLHLPIWGPSPNMDIVDVMCFRGLHGVVCIGPLSVNLARPFTSAGLAHSIGFDMELDHLLSGLFG